MSTYTALSAWIAGKLGQVLSIEFGSVNCRYLDALLDDVMIKDQERVAILQINFKDNSTNFTDPEVVWAGLNALEAVGGVFLKPGVMLLDDMTNLLKFEAAVHWEEEYPDLVMAHPAARVLDGVRKLPDQHSMGEALALLDTGHLVKRYHHQHYHYCACRRCCLDFLTILFKSMT